MAGKVKMYNEELDAYYLAPEGALDHYEARGWLVVDEPTDAEMIKAGKPRVRKTINPKEKPKAAAKKK